MTKPIRHSIIILALALAIGQQAHTSNMGFKFRIKIHPLGPYPIGRHHIALPWVNPYTHAQDICDRLNLSAGGQVSQINAQSGTIKSHQCGAGANFALIERVGIIVTDPNGASGILVGEHSPDPEGPGLNLFGLGAYPKGENHVPVPYHMVGPGAVIDSQLLCGMLSLTDATIIRRDPKSGITMVHQCGLGGGFPLVRGESVIIRYDGPTKSYAADVPWTL